MAEILDNADALTLGLFSADGLSTVTAGLLAEVPVHHRTRIRNWAVARLQGEAIRGDRIHASPIFELDDEELPVVFVWTRDESADRLGTNGYRRDLELVIDVVVDMHTDVEQQVDAVAHLVEILLLTDRTFGELAADSVLASTEKSFTGEGESRRALCRLTFVVSYVSHFKQPSGDDLRTVRASVDLAMPDGVAEAVDDIVLPAQEE